jgi:hypothetical protein
VTIGITYCVLKTEGGRESLEEHVYTNWPKGGGFEKVPSEISYSTTSGVERQWGFDIAPGSLKFVWTKLELDQQERSEELVLILKALDGMGNLDPENIREADGLPSYPAKDSVDIVAEYLTKVREYVRDHPQLHPTYLSMPPIDLVVTVPAVSDAPSSAIGLANLSIRIGQTKPRIEPSVPSARLVSINRTSKCFRTSSW